MKNLFSIITLVCMTLSIQANNFINPDGSNGNTLPNYLFADMNLMTIKSDIDNNKRSYFMTGSFTVLKTPTKKDGDVAKTVDVSFRNNQVLSRKGSTYIQANAQAKRNDNNSINEFRIYVNHEKNNEKIIDKRNIKVNWKTGSLEVVDKLKNVSVIYQEDGILIIGTMQKNGFTIGVTLAISKDVKLI